MVLPDGRNYRFVWSGLMGRTSLHRSRNGTLGVDFGCHRCNHKFAMREPYYHRKGSHMKRSRYYCLPCAELLDFIEPVSWFEVLTAQKIAAQQVTKLDREDSGGQVTPT